MLKRFRSFAAATLLARLFGYARDLLIAHFVGGGQWADIYFAGFRLANLARRLVGEGGLYAAYTPIYASLLVKNEKNANTFALDYGKALACGASLLVILGIMFAHPLTTLLLPGFRADAKLIELTAMTTRTLFPFLLFVALAAWVQATLQANGKFFLSSLSPAAASLTIIAYLLTGARFSASFENHAAILMGLAWATVLGGLLQFLIQIPQFVKTTDLPRPHNLWQGHPELKKSFMLLGPYLIIFSLEQISSLVDTFFGSLAGAGAIAALYNASRIVQMPVGLVGIGALVTTLPEFSQMIQMGKHDELRRALKRNRNFILALQIPTVLICMAAAYPIIKLLYFHGRFDESALKLTGSVLTAAAPSMLFYSLQKLYVSLFYAHHDVKSVSLISGLQLGVNIIGCALLIRVFGAPGIALMSSLASLCGLLFMVALAKTKKYF